MVSIPVSDVNSSSCRIRSSSCRIRTDIGYDDTVVPLGSEAQRRRSREILEAGTLVEEIAERYQAGATLDDLAVLYKDSFPRSNPRLIRRLLVSAGVKIRSKGRPADASRPGHVTFTTAKISLSVEELTDRYRAGTAIYDLAIQCRCSASTIHRILFEAGVEIRGRSGRNGARKKS
jgi:hypothetical protein